jgi:hypothetical protein
MMSKNKQRREQRIPNPPGVVPRMPPGTPFQLGYDPKGQMVPVDVVSSKEAWSEFTLSDGSVVRTKAALLEVKRAVGQYSADGNPIYVFQFAGLNQLIVPDDLKKKG